MVANLLIKEQSLESKACFELEARAVSCLAHPHVITVFDVGVTEYGEPYIVMKHLQGKSLSLLMMHK